eukprot:scaffold86285_cov67-Attheya_sp.AAC.2
MEKSSKVFFLGYAFFSLFLNPLELVYNGEAARSIDTLMDKHWDRSRETRSWAVMLGLSLGISMLRALASSSALRSWLNADAE